LKNELRKDAYDAAESSLRALAADSSDGWLVIGWPRGDQIMVKGGTRKAEKTDPDSVITEA